MSTSHFAFPLGGLLATHTKIDPPSHDQGFQGVFRGIVNQEDGMSNELNATELLDVLRNGTPHRHVYKGQDSNWYVTYSGGKTSFEAVRELLRKRLIQSVYSTPGLECYHIGPTIDCEASMAERRKVGIAKARIIYMCHRHDTSNNTGGDMSIVERLSAWTTDWDGSRMVDGEPPRDGLHCDILREAAATITELVEALKPFGALDRFGPFVPDDAMVILTSVNGGIIDTDNEVSVGHLRAARAALIKATGEKQ
jgi:hypothetical protein